MKKNFINWKRTPCGSVCEILCPLLLMLLLVYARLTTAPQYKDNYTLYSLRHPLYPVAAPAPDGSMQVSLLDQQRQMEEYRPFFEYADMINVNNTVVVPITISKPLDEARQTTGQPPLSLAEIVDPSDAGA